MSLFVPPPSISGLSHLPLVRILVVLPDSLNLTQNTPRALKGMYPLMICPSFFSNSSCSGTLGGAPAAAPSAQHSAEEPAAEVVTQRPLSPLTDLDESVGPTDALAIAADPGADSDGKLTSIEPLPVAPASTELALDLFGRRIPSLPATPKLLSMDLVTPDASPFKRSATSPPLSDVSVSPTKRCRHKDSLLTSGGTPPFILFRGIKFYPAPPGDVDAAFSTAPDSSHVEAGANVDAKLEPAFALNPAAPALADSTAFLSDGVPATAAPPSSAGESSHPNAASGPDPALDAGALLSEPLFDDGGLGAAGCLREYLMGSLLMNTYRTVVNRPMPTIYPLSAMGIPPAEFDFADFEAACELAPLLVRRSIVNTTIFSDQSMWINPSRANPTSVVATAPPSGKGLRLMARVDPRFLAVFLTTGVVRKSRLYDPVVVGERVLRQIEVSPFEQEAQLLFGFFAATFNVTELAVAISQGDILFNSMQRFKDKNDSNVEGPPDYSPTESIRVAPRPPQYADGDPRLKLLATFPAAVPFRSPIPIYDGRAHGTRSAFEAGANQLCELGVKSYPLYGSGMVDLPPKSVVAIGYTAHTYPTARHYQGIATALSLNVAFVILLSLPLEVPGPINEDLTTLLSDGNPAGAPLSSAKALA